MRLCVFIVYGFIGCVHIPYAFLIISIWKQCAFVPLRWPCPSSLLTLTFSHQNWTQYSSQKYKGRVLFFFVLSVYPDHKQILARFGSKKQSSILQIHVSSVQMLNTVLCRSTYGNAFSFMPLSHLPPQTSWIYLIDVRSSLPQAVIFLEETREVRVVCRVIWEACRWPGNLDGALRSVQLFPWWAVFLQRCVYCLSQIHVLTKEETSGIHQFHLFGITKINFHLMFMNSSFFKASP